MKNFNGRPIIWLLLYILKYSLAVNVDSLIYDHLAPTQFDQPQTLVEYYKNDVNEDGEVYEEVHPEKFDNVAREENIKLLPNGYAAIQCPHHEIVPTTQQNHNRNDYRKYKVDNVTTIYLAGYDDQIFKLMQDIQNHGQGHELLVYFYLYKNRNYHNLGHLYTDKDTLKHNIVKYTHYFCVDNNATKSAWCLSGLDTKTNVEIIQESNTGTLMNKFDDTIVTPSLDSAHERLTKSYEFILPKEADVNFKDIHVGVFEGPTRLVDNKVVNNSRGLQSTVIPYGTISPTNEIELSSIPNVHKDDLYHLNLPTEKNNNNNDIDYIGNGSITNNTNLYDNVAQKTNKDNALFEYVLQSNEHDNNQITSNFNDFIGQQNADIIYENNARNEDNKNNNTLFKNNLYENQIITTQPFFNIINKKGDTEPIIANNPNVLLEYSIPNITDDAIKGISSEIDIDPYIVQDNNLGLQNTLKVNTESFDENYNQKSECEEMLGNKNITEILLTKNDIMKMNSERIGNEVNKNDEIAQLDNIEPQQKKYYTIHSKEHEHVNNAIGSKQGTNEKLEKLQRTLILNKSPSINIDRSLPLNSKNTEFIQKLNYMKPKLVDETLSSILGTYPEKGNTIPYLASNFPFHEFKIPYYYSKPTVNTNMKMLPSNDKPRFESYIQNKRVKTFGDRFNNILPSVYGGFNKNDTIWNEKQPELDKLNNILNANRYTFKLDPLMYFTHNLHDHTNPNQRNIIKYLEPIVNHKLQGSLDLPKVYRNDNKIDFANQPQYNNLQLKDNILPKVKSDISDINPTVLNVPNIVLQDSTEALDYNNKHICPSKYLVNTNSGATLSYLPYYPSKVNAPTAKINQTEIGNPNEYYLLDPCTYKNLLTLQGGIKPYTETPKVNLHKEMPSKLSHNYNKNCLGNTLVPNYSYTNLPLIEAKKKSVKIYVNGFPTSHYYDTYISNLPLDVKKSLITKSVRPDANKIFSLPYNDQYTVSTISTIPKLFSASIYPKYISTYPIYNKIPQTQPYINYFNKIDYSLPETNNLLKPIVNPFNIESVIEKSLNPTNLNVIEPSKLQTDSLQSTYDTTQFIFEPLAKNQFKSLLQPKPKPSNQKPCFQLKKMVTSLPYGYPMSTNIKPLTQVVSTLAHNMSNLIPRKQVKTFSQIILPTSAFYPDEQNDKKIQVPKHLLSSSTLDVAIPHFPSENQFRHETTASYTHLPRNAIMSSQPKLDQDILLLGQIPCIPKAEYAPKSNILSYIFPKKWGKLDSTSYQKSTPELQRTSSCIDLEAPMPILLENNNQPAPLLSSTVSYRPNPSLASLLIKKQKTVPLSIRDRYKFIPYTTENTTPLQLSNVHFNGDLPQNMESFNELLPISIPSISYNLKFNPYKGQHSTDLKESLYTYYAQPENKLDTNAENIISLHTNSREKKPYWFELQPKTFYSVEPSSLTNALPISLSTKTNYPSLSSNIKPKYLKSSTYRKPSEPITISILERNKPLESTYKILSHFRNVKNISSAIPGTYTSQINYLKPQHLNFNIDSNKLSQPCIKATILPYFNYIQPKTEQHYLNFKDTTPSIIGKPVELFAQGNADSATLTKSDTSSYLPKQSFSYTNTSPELEANKFPYYYQFPQKINLGNVTSSKLISPYYDFGPFPRKFQYAATIEPSQNKNNYFYNSPEIPQKTNPALYNVPVKHGEKNDFPYQVTSTKITNQYPTSDLGFKNDLNLRFPTTPTPTILTTNLHNKYKFYPKAKLTSPGVFGTDSTKYNQNTVIKIPSSELISSDLTTSPTFSTPITLDVKCNPFEEKSKSVGFSPIKELYMENISTLGYSPNKYNFICSSHKPREKLKTDPINTLYDQISSKIINVTPSKYSKHKITFTPSVTPQTETGTIYPLSSKVCNPILRKPTLSQTVPSYNYIPSNIQQQLLPSSDFHATPSRTTIDYTTHNVPSISFSNLQESTIPIITNENNLSSMNVICPHIKKVSVPFISPLNNNLVKTSSECYLPSNSVVTPKLTPDFQQSVPIALGKGTTSKESSTNKVSPQNVITNFADKQSQTDIKPVLTTLPNKYYTSTKLLPSLIHQNLLSNNNQYTNPIKSYKDNDFYRNKYTLISQTSNNEGDEIYQSKYPYTGKAFNIQDIKPTEINTLNLNLNNFIKRPDILNNMLKENLITVPLENIGIAKCEPTKLEKACYLKTDNSDVYLKMWPSAIRIVKAKIVLECDELHALNFAPVVKTGHYTQEGVMKVVKDYVTKSYGEPIIVKGVYNPQQPYAYVDNVDEKSIKNGKVYILWPTICNCGCEYIGCQCQPYFKEIRLC